MTASLSKDALKAQYVGRSLYNVTTPAAILDLAKLQFNCAAMLESVHRLGMGWRAHIKTHKTTELTRLQLGDTGPANIIVSTILEAENVLPLMKEYQESSRKVNILYAFPLYASCVDRLAAISAQLGPGGLSVMIDHPDQIINLAALASKSGNLPLVFLKIDMGYHRAGTVPNTPLCNDLVDKILLSQSLGTCVLLGLYAHAGQSYYTRDDWQALEYLSLEFKALQEVARSVRNKRPGHPLVLSIGATPTATSLQHPDFTNPLATPELMPTFVTTKLKSTFEELRLEDYILEVHAGVYPTLDLQQLATHARNSDYLTSDNIAISVLADIASIYPGRGSAGTTEALVNAGSLALGREPCKDMGEVQGQHYDGWGVVMPWGVNNPAPGPEFPMIHVGWEVGRISQEHGILTWAGKVEDEAPLKIGQRVRIWPNHACIAGAGFEWYLVTDSRNRGREDEIIDVWPRWKGW